MTTDRICNLLLYFQLCRDISLPHFETFGRNFGHALSRSSTFISHWLATISSLFSFEFPALDPFHPAPELSFLIYSISIPISQVLWQSFPLPFPRSYKKFQFSFYTPSPQLFHLSVFSLLPILILYAIIYRCLINIDGNKGLQWCVELINCTLMYQFIIENGEYQRRCFIKNNLTTIIWLFKNIKTNISDQRRVITQHSVQNKIY